tara:strand:- start:274 stop:855 length:582 start_codon:yes stop_codon:yes gene_type:complete
MSKVWKIVIPNYIDKVPISKRRRAKYYKRKDLSKPNIAKKYTDGIKNGIYKYDKQGYLIDQSKNRVLSNPISAGTPKYWTINGQRMYDGTLHYTARAKITKWMHEYLRQFIEDLPVIKLQDGEYLRVWVDMYKPLQVQNWDCDNQWPWTKWLLDTCVELGKIPDDSIQIVRSSGQVTYIPSDERKLVFNITII